MRFARDMFLRAHPQNTICPSGARYAAGDPPCPFAARKNPSRSRSEHIAREFTSAYRVERSEIYRIALQGNKSSEQSEHKSYGSRTATTKPPALVPETEKTDPSGRVRVAVPSLFDGRKKTA